MGLFDVKGWGLEDQKVVPGLSKKEEKKRQRKRREVEERRSHKHRRVEGGEGEEGGRHHRHHDRSGESEDKDESHHKHEKSHHKHEKSHHEHDEHRHGSRDDDDKNNDERNNEKVDDEKVDDEKVDNRKGNGEGEKKDNEKNDHCKNEDDENKKDHDGPHHQPILPINTSHLTPLQKKMLHKLSGSRFRWINEKLYTSNSANAFDMMKKQPDLFDEYHKGFKSQVESWPENPVDVYIKQLVFRGVNKHLNSPGGLRGLDVDGDRTVVVADMGCGEAELAVQIDKFMDFYHNDPKKALKVFKRKYGGDSHISLRNKKLKFQVHSFDLKKVNDKITVADIKHVPLKDRSCSVAIFCLALMGTNFLDFIREAHRILAPGGELWIAEIQSRLSDDTGEEFSSAIEKLGFKHKVTDTSNKMFTLFEFYKPIRNIEIDDADMSTIRDGKSEGEWLLKPCIYKRR